LDGGWAGSRGVTRRSPAAGAFAVALWPVGWAASDQVQRARARHVPPAIQARLSTGLSLGDLCPGSAVPAALQRDIRRRAAALVQELERHPDDLVTYTYVLADEPGVSRVDITVREVAQEELRDMKSNDSRCEPDLQRRLEAGIG
jgi:hypothetical protein